MYCVIKCVKNKCVLKGSFTSSVFHSCNAKTQKTQICLTGPQCVKRLSDILTMLHNWQNFLNKEFCVEWCNIFWFLLYQTKK
jgi:hypothetical protein